MWKEFVFTVSPCVCICHIAIENDTNNADYNNDEDDDDVDDGNDDDVKH